MKCHLCGEHDTSPATLLEDIQLILEHFRLFHPDHYADIEKWPDGQVIVHDDTMEPEDFA